MDNQQGRPYLIPLPNHKDYYCDVDGNLYSTKCSSLRRLTVSPHWGRGKTKYYLRTKLDKTCGLAHRFIASVLVGRKLTSGEVVNHLNGDTTDNRLVNLEVVSHTENVKHAVENSLYCSGDAWHKARK
jgi:hypothetical protein